MKDKQSNLWGIDLGGTKIEGAVLKSASNPEVLFRERIPTEGHLGYDHIVNQIKCMVEKMENALGYRSSHIGIATPGAVNPQAGTMKNCNTTCLNGRFLKDDLEKILSVKIALANDANCFALAETNMGIVKEKFPHAQVVFGVIMGTGVGGGVVVNGRPINGFHGIGGEWGHNFLDDSGGKCYCGKTGCVEKILAGPALENYYFGLSGQKLRMKEIYDRYKIGNDDYATKTIERMLIFFGKALSTVVNIIDPDVIVIGGGVGNIDLLYSEGRKSVSQYVFNDGVFETPLVQPKLGDSAGVYGAAFLHAEM